MDLFAAQTIAGWILEAGLRIFLVLTLALVATIASTGGFWLATTKRPQDLANGRVPGLARSRPRLLTAIGLVVLGWCAWTGGLVWMFDRASSIGELRTRGGTLADLEGIVILVIVMLVLVPVPFLVLRLTQDMLAAENEEDQALNAATD